LANYYYFIRCTCTKDVADVRVTGWVCEKNIARNSFFVKIDTYLLPWKEVAKKFGLLPWRRGAMDIASDSGTRGPGFESHQGIRFLGKHCSDVVYKMPYEVCIVCVLNREIKTLATKNKFLKMKFGLLL
jgi:hypothetical protein